MQLSLTPFRQASIKPVRQVTDAEIERLALLAGGAMSSPEYLDFGPAESETNDLKPA